MDKWALFLCQRLIGVQQISLQDSCIVESTGEDDDDCVGVADDDCEKLLEEMKMNV